MVKAIIPTTLKETLEHLDSGNFRIVAGGTDMLVQHHNLSKLPINYKDDVIYIANLDELKGITEDEDSVYIGACETLEAIMEHPLTPQLLKETIHEMASPAIRHTGTLAGNIANASPAGDSLVPLYLMNAILEIQSFKGIRRIDIKEFIKGVRKIDLAKDELITRIIIDKLEFTKAYFKKVGPRLSDAISKLSFAGAVHIEEGLVMDLRFAFGAVNVTVVRRPEIEARFIATPVEEVRNSADEIVNLYQEYIRPIDDQRSNKEYRKQVSLNLLREFIQNI